MKIPFIGGTLLLILFTLTGVIFAGVIVSVFGSENLLIKLTFTQIIVWLLPALLYAYCFYDDVVGDLKIKNFGKPACHGWFILLYAISIPLVGYLLEISQTIAFPESLIELSRKMEADTKEVVLNLLSGGTLTGLMSALFVMAVLPAICEEVFFRGVVLNNLVKRTSKIHLSVWLSAILFSAVHLEVFGFFPRIVLGVILGYAFVYSKSLWVPIILHFLNNALVVFAYFLYQREVISVDPSDDMPVPIWLVATCLVLGFVLFRFLLNRYRVDVHACTKNVNHCSEERSNFE